MPLDDARQRTKAFLAEIADGNDLQQEKMVRRKTWTISEMLESYLDQYARHHKRSWESDQKTIALHLVPAFGKLRVDELLNDQVRSWHSSLCKARTPATANRYLALLRKAYSEMQPEIPNPCRKVRMFREESRDRFFQAVESERKASPDIADYVLLSLFTGARHSNVLGIRWKDIDLNLMQWRIPAADSKNKSVMVILLVDEAVAILEQRKATTSSVFVLPGPGKTGRHLQEPRKGWLRILKRANVRLHDLRRTLGSWQTIGGASTAIVGRTQEYGEYSRLCQNDP